MKTRTAGLIQLHSSVLLFGLSGLFGKLLSQPAVIIVLARVCLSSLFLFCLCMAGKQTLCLKNTPMTVKLCACGILLAFHWFCFYQSIQLSTVSVGLLTFALFPVIVTVCEPLIFSERFSKSDLFLAFLAFLRRCAFVRQCDSAAGSCCPDCYGALCPQSAMQALALLNRSFSARPARLGDRFLSAADSGGGLDAGAVLSAPCIFPS